MTNRHCMPKLAVPVAAAVAVAAGWVVAAQPATASTNGLVISQVYAGGRDDASAFRDNYVEIFNAGATPVDLEHVLLGFFRDGALQGTWNLHGTMVPGQWHLYRSSIDGQSGRGVAPLPDWDGDLTLDLPLDGGVVALGFEGEASFIDTLGFGSHALPALTEGGQPAPSEGPTGPHVRSTTHKAGGCRDTDVNADDFALLPANPHNSSSTATPCAAPPGGPGPGGSNQAVNLDIASTQALSISLARSAVTLGTISAGAATPPADIGDIHFANTLADTSVWSATVAATPLQDGTGHSLPYTAMTYAPGALSASAGATGLPSGGATGPFAGADPGFSDPLLLTSGGTARGDFTQSGSTLTATAPPGQVAGSYAGVLQYTIASSPA